jgi:hypothetical protein
LPFLSLSGGADRANVARHCSSGEDLRSLLRLHLVRSTRLRRKLQYRRLLAGAQTSKEHHLSVGQLQCVVIVLSVRQFSLVIDTGLPANNVATFIKKLKAGSKRRLRELGKPFGKTCRCCGADVTCFVADRDVSPSDAVEKRSGVA